MSVENQEGHRVAITPGVIVSSPATLSICPTLQEVLTHQPHLLGPLRGPLSLGVRSVSFRFTLLLILPAPSECPGPQCPHYPTHLQPLPAEICGQAPAFLLPLWPITSNPLPSGSPPQPPSVQPPINTECYLQNECRPPEGLLLREKGCTAEEPWWERRASPPPPHPPRNGSCRPGPLLHQKEALKQVPGPPSRSTHPRDG